MARVVVVTQSANHAVHRRHGVAVVLSSNFPPCRGDGRRTVNVPMKSPWTLLIAFALLVGCAKPPGAASPHRYPDVESAIDALATSEDIQDANAAAAQIYAGGIPAIYALRGHLHDDRLIPSGFCTRALNRYDMLTVSDQALWTIQEMLEPDLPKAYDHADCLLREKRGAMAGRNTRGLSIAELRAEVAREAIN